VPTVETMRLVWFVACVTQNEYHPCSQPGAFDWDACTLLRNVPL